MIYNSIIAQETTLIDLRHFLYNPRLKAKWKKRITMELNAVFLNAIKVMIEDLQLNENNLEEVAG
jgi:hypothetical protein